MSDIKVASRYAKSIIGLAQEQNALESLKDDMVLFDKIVDENPELEAILKNPIIALDKKYAILNDLFKDKMSALSLSFFKLTINKGRSEILYTTAKQVIAQYNLIKGIVIAEVTSATPLNAAALAEIKQIIISNLKVNEVRINEHVDAKLIGGFIIKVNDIQFDTSIANQLKELKKELV